MPTPTPYDRQLLEQAHHLASKDKQKPTQASLRRAVSSAYYALFHRLIRATTEHVIGQQAKGKPLRQLLARTFIHAEMADASKAFSKACNRGIGGLPASLQPCVPAGVVASDLGNVCDAFVELQEARHRADYDLSKRLYRREALAFVQSAERAMNAWNAIISDPASQTYMVSLLVWKKVRKD